MRLSPPLAVVLAAALLLAAVLGSLVLWGSGGSDLIRRAQEEPTGDKQAIFTATAAPTATPTPVPTGTVVRVVYRCMLYYHALDYFTRQEPSDVDPVTACVPPYPPGLTLRDLGGEPLYEVRGLQLTITIRRDTGELFEVDRTGPFPIAVGDRWPPE